jgi:molecular chaperone DnaK (HSP70)
LKDLFVAPPDYERTAEDITAEYLTALRRHAVSHIERLYGNAVVKDCRFDWIITVPAVWSDAAKKKTMAAALRAGMGNTTSLQMTSEPEAAAVYALKALDPHHIKVGESVVICDAGGGTVDLITYKMKSVSYPFSVEESAIGGGSQCGSTFLNRRFEEFLNKKLNGKSIPENARAMVSNPIVKESEIYSRAKFINDYLSV